MPHPALMKTLKQNKNLNFKFMTWNMRSSEFAMYLIVQYVMNLLNNFFCIHVYYIRGLKYFFVFRKVRWSCIA